LNSSFVNFSEFLEQNNFEIQANQSFLHIKAKLLVFYVSSENTTKIAAQKLQKEVLELRKKGFSVFVVREQVWENKSDLIRKIIVHKTTKLISVFARDLVVEQISEKVAKDFLETNHLLGFCKGRKYFSISIPAHRAFRFQKYNFSKILAVAVFGKNISRKKVGFEGDKSIEWSRFATLPEIRIVGGLTKVLKYLQEVEHFDDIMTYVAIETNDSKGLRGMGFVLEEITEPFQLGEEFNLGNYKLRYVKS